MTNEDDNDTLLQPGRINSLMLRLISEAFDEVYHMINTGIKGRCPALSALRFQVEMHGEPYREAMGLYNDAIRSIERKFGNPRLTSPQEALLRLRAMINLAKRIGSFELKERYKAPQPHALDEVVFTVFDYVEEIKNVPDDIQLVKDLKEFYYDELRKEYENKPDMQRHREAERRAKRNYLFFIKYNEYAKSGFDMSRIEEIFGLTDEEQDILNYWISEMLYHGSATLVFAEQGKGKSNTGSFFVQAVLIMRPEWDAITNVPFVFAPGIEFNPDYKIERVKIVENMSGMLKESAKSVIAGRYPAAIIDEFDSSYSAPETRSKKGMTFKSYVYVERHLDNQGPLLIYHSYRDIPVEMRQGDVAHETYKISWYINRVARRMRRIIVNPYSWFNGQMGGYRYFPIPLSSLAYMNQGWSPFDIDVDMKWINAHLRGSKKQAAEQLLKYLEKRPFPWEEVDNKKKDDNGTGSGSGTPPNPSPS